jgi:predicted transcriptional regulator
MNYRKLITVTIAMIMISAAVPGFAADVNELERRLDIVSEELDRMKNSSGGSGIAHRTTVHGYGETHWTAATDDAAKVDQHRFVIGVHSEISNWIHLNAEIDFEHAAQELEFEFGHLDFLVSQQLNFRAGTMLMPMGNLNEFHEPNNFYTPERPDFHAKLIPSTWQQAGFGLWGSKGDISYRFYLTNAISSLDESRYVRQTDFIRKGRSQISSGLLVNDIAVTARVEKKTPGGQAGFSFYTSGTTGDHIEEDGQLTIIEADYKTKRGPWDLDFGIMKGWLEDTEQINNACGTAFGLACTTVAPESAFGMIATLAVHVPELMKMNTIHDVIPFIQYQKVRPNDEEGVGSTHDDNANYDVLTVGAAYKPHPQVALKMAYRSNYYEGDEAAGAKAGAAGTTVNYFDMAVAYQY